MVILLTIQAISVAIMTLGITQLIILQDMAITHIMPHIIIRAVITTIAQLLITINIIVLAVIMQTTAISHMPMVKM